ncbi:MAG TPA: polyhydroxyalkanoate depolymerase, partial [Aquabacterium sp.]|nr:polyhydroxyalkanoate depolymerase [Aquabacterium sp.]
TEQHRQFYDEYNAVLDMPAEYYLETIKTVFQDFALVNGTWNVKGTLVRPQDITTSALLTVEGELDDISGSGQTQAAHGLCTGIPDDRKTHYELKGAGHYGIFSGRRWRDIAYPVVRDFIRSHNPAALPPGDVPAPAPQADSPTTPAMAAPVVASAQASVPVRAAVVKARTPRKATKRN